jgi:hypothetical protein
MARKILGQNAPSATTATTLYTVPASTETVVSSITICNRGASAGTARIAVREDGDALANAHYVLYDASIPANDTLTLTIGLTLEATDVITVYASSADFTFNAYGQEVTV